MSKKLTLVWRAAMLAGFAMLAGCEGSVTVDMGATAATDPTVQQVLVDLEGVELSGSGGTETLQFDEPERVNLVEFVNGTLFRLFTDEEISDGRYTGARLLFDTEDDDEDDVVVLSDGRQFDLTVAEGTSADVSFEVDKDDSSRDDVVLTLDLRQSLSFDDDEDVFSLTPVVRGVRVEDSGEIAGNVTANCPAGSSLAGGAVYLFANEDRTPDDRDGGGEEPYLTTAVISDGGPGARYSFPFIPEGDYTIALTCEGDEDDPATDDDLRFQNVANVEVRAEETLTHDLD